MVKVKEDLSGQRFGRLTVVYQTDDYVDPQGRHKARWYCLCDCGNYISVNADLLKSGNTKSCGCLSIDSSIKRNKKQNFFDLSGEYGIGYTLKGDKFYFDLEDYDKIKDYCWYKDNCGYIVTHNNTIQSFPNHLKLHRLIMDNPKLEVDHINNQPYDNRKINLRLATSSQQKMNQKIRKDNTSGCRGVWWHNKNKRWIADIMINGKKIRIGSFMNLNDAINARQKAEQKFFGEFRYNVTNKQNNIKEAENE